MNLGSSGQKSRARSESLQSYRAIAAFAVVLHHVNGKFAASHYYGAVVPHVFLWGQAGVDFFFVLSGFIITQSLLRSQTAREFLLHRAIRVFPPFWLAFFFTLPIAMALSGELHSPVNHDWLSLIKAALLLPQPDPPVIGVAWTLHHEILFYAMAGAWIRFPMPVSAAALVLLLGSAINFDGFLAQFIFSPLHWEFVAGAVAYRLSQRMPSTWAFSTMLVSGMGVIVACTWFMKHHAFDIGWPRYLIFASLFAVLVAASAKWEMSSNFAKTRLSRLGSALGDSSYTLYLWHIPIVTPVTKLVFKAFPGLNPLAVLLLTVTIATGTAIASHVIYRLIERPMVNSIRRRIDLLLHQPN